MGKLNLVVENCVGKSIGTNAVGSLITDCKNNGLLLQEKLRAPYTLGKYKHEQKNKFQVNHFNKYNSIIPYHFTLSVYIRY